MRHSANFYLVTSLLLHVTAGPAPCVASQRQQKYSVKPGTRFTSASISRLLLETEARSLVACAALCTSNPECSAANYRAVEKQCSLVVVAADEELTMEDGAFSFTAQDIWAAKTTELEIRTRAMDVSTVSVGPRAWHMVFKACYNTGTSAYDLWTSTDFTEEPSNDDYDPELVLDHHFKSKDVESWTTLDITQARMRIYPAGDEPAKELVFDATSSGKTSWFLKSRLTSSSWTDLNKDSVNDWFSMEGNAQAESLRFRINKNSDPGCENQHGWLAVRDGDIYNECSWAQEDEPKYPVILYSTGDSVAHWGTDSSGAIEVADTLTIEIYY